MWQESSESQQPLRTGFTTGTCATACCVAAATALLKKEFPAMVSVTLPKGKTVELNVESELKTEQSAHASTVKDAGDDPDITHGATVWVNLTLVQERGVTFSAGLGVGTVTKTGLLLDINEPAINPVPRDMMTKNLTAVAEESGYKHGFNVEVGVINGENLALKTMNPRLGILGGLSILGTTGIVRPFSCAAWIASIYQGIDVAAANELSHIAASTGNASEAYVQGKYGLPDTALIEMGDFAGAVLKHLKDPAIKTLTICGGFGKISKLANGHVDLHSRVSSIDFNHLKNVAVQLGASENLQTQIEQANTTKDVLSYCQQENVNIGAEICRLALAFSLTKIKRDIRLEVIAIDRKGDEVGTASNFSAGEQA